MASENDSKGSDSNSATIHQPQHYEAMPSERKGYVVKYGGSKEFPFEEGETVWIVKPGCQALGEFRIVKAHPDNMYEIFRLDDNTPHSELVKGGELRRQL